MPSALQAKIQLDFSKGLNMVTSPYLIGGQQVSRLINMILDEHGSLRTRDGSLIVASNTLQEPTAKFTKLYDYIKTNGTIKKLALIKGASVTKLLDRSTTPMTLIGSFGTASDTPDVVTFAGLAFLSNMNEPIAQYDGSTFTPSALPPPKVRHIVVHLGFMWAWGTDSSTSTLDGPSSLRSSDVNLPSSWPSSNQTFVSKDDGQTAQGMGLYTVAETGISPTAVMIAFKDFSAYEVSGVFGSSNFSVQKIKSDMGCVAPRSIQFASGFGIIRLTHRGFALYDGVNDTLISEEVRPYLFGRDDVIGIDWPNVSLSMAAQSQNPPLYLCACPVVGETGLERVFVFDLVRKAWSVCAFTNNASTLSMILNPNALPVLLAGDYNKGNVRRWFAGDPDDDGQAFTWLVRVRPAFGSSPMQRAYYRRMVAKFYDTTAGQVISAQFSFGPSQAARVQNQVVPVGTSLSTIAGYGLSTYGTSPYGSVASVQSLTDVDLPFDLGMIADNVIAEISGTGKVRLRGLEWHLRAKPLTVPLGVH